MKGSRYYLGSIVVPNLPKGKSRILINSHQNITGLSFSEIEAGKWHIYFNGVDKDNKIQVNATSIELIHEQVLNNDNYYLIGHHTTPTPRSQIGLFASDAYYDNWWTAVEEGPLLHSFHRYEDLYVDLFANGVTGNSINRSKYCIVLLFTLNKNSLAKKIVLQY
jgi:hypothetical protein